MPQWMRDVLPPQVPQGLKGLLRQQEEEEEEEGCEPCQEKLQLQGTQGWWLLLGQHLPPVPPFCQCPCILSIKYFIVKRVSVMI